MSELLKPGWRSAGVIIACGTGILLANSGFRASYGVFLLPMTAELGWTRESFAFALALQNLIWGVGQPFSGAIADRYGSGRVIASGAVIYALGMYVSAHATDPVGFTLGAGVLVGIGTAGTGFSIVLGAISRAAPPERRSVALGIATAGGSLGQLLLPVGQAFIAVYGWSTALTLLAFGSLIIVPLASAIVGKPAQSIAGDPAGIARQGLRSVIGAAGRHGSYLLLNAGFFVCGFQTTFIIVHLPAYFADRGASPMLGATVISVIGLFNVMGAYLAGWLGDKLPKRYLLSGIYLARSATILFLIAMPLNTITAIVFGAVLGFLWLSTVPLTGGLVGVMFGVRYMATLFGIVMMSHQIGAFIGIWAGGRLYDVTGSYDLMWWLSIALGLAAAVLHWPIKERVAPALAQAA